MAWLDLGEGLVVQSEDIGAYVRIPLTADLRAAIIMLNGGEKRHLSQGQADNFERWLAWQRYWWHVCDCATMGDAPPPDQIPPQGT